MANVILHTSDLLDAAKKMEDAANRIEEALGKLDTIMSDLDAVWLDANSKKYLEKYAELKAGFPKAKEDIYSYSSFLNSVVQAYKREFVDPTSSSIK